MTGIQQDSTVAGAMNLLVNCSQCRAGQALLIVREAKNSGYYSDNLAAHVRGVASDFGMTVVEEEVTFDPATNQLDERLQALISIADHVVFLARIGDQIRFKETQHAQKLIVCYALSKDMLESSFGAADYAGFQALKALVDNALNTAKTIRVTCAEGTDFSGPGIHGAKPATDTTLKRFPLSVFSPVPAHTFSGVVAQRGFLVGTGSTFYQPYACEISDVLRIRFEQGRIVDFEGLQEDVEAAREHYQKISQPLGIDRDFIHSWHAGIHPGCNYEDFAGDNFERWSGGAFGNPRLLHLHTCGAYAPGEISLNVMDPTIAVDGVALWDHGRFCPERIDGGSDILDRYSGLRTAFANPAQNIGQASSGKLVFRAHHK